MAELYRTDICNVDISKSLVRSYAGIVLATGDKNANRFGARLYRAGEPVDLSAQGVAVTGYFIRPNAETVACAGAADGNMVYVDLPAACYTASGTFSLAVKVSSTEVTQTVRVVDGCIRLTQTDTLVDPGAVVPSLDELLAHIAEMETVVDDAQRAAEIAASPIVADVSGETVSTDDAAARDAVGLISTINAVQAGEGTASPDNVRPISGWDAVNLTRTGRNLVSHQDCKLTYGNKSTVITDDYIDVTVPATYDYGNIPVRLKGGVAYTLYVICEVYGRDAAATNSTTIRIRFEKANPYEQDIKATANGTYTKLQRYTPVTDVEENILLYANFGSPVPASVRMQVMLLEGDYALDTVPPFEPCARQTLTEALPETVYGGTLDWTSGVLTVTHRRIELTGAENWSSNTDTNAGQFYAKRLLTGNESTTSTTNGFCTHYRYANGYAGKDNKIVQGHGAHVWLVDTDFATVEDVKAYLAAQAEAGTPVTVAYPLATPYTIQLDPQQLTLLKGSNTVWSDCGNTTMAYVADTKLYIDKKFTALQNAILAQGANI